MAAALALQPEEQRSYRAVSPRGASDARADYRRDLEDLALGGLLLDDSGDTARKVFATLAPNDFSDALRREVATAAKNLADQDHPVTLVTVWGAVIKSAPKIASRSRLAEFASWVDEISSAAPALQAARALKIELLESEARMIHADAAEHDESEESALRLKAIREELDRLATSGTR